MRVEAGGGGHEAGGGLVVEKLGERLVEPWQVGPEDRVPGGCVGMVPFDQSFDDDPEPTQTQIDRRLLQWFAVMVLSGGEEQLVGLDVSTGDLT